MHESAYRDMERFTNRYLSRGPYNVAEIGSAYVNGSVRNLFARPGWQHTGYDIVPGPGVDHVLPSEYDWPDVPLNYYDVVVTTQTLEHVRMPWEWLLSIRRITKPGGLIYVCCPNTHPYHAHPVDCYRVWPEGMRGLMEWAELEVLECYATPYTVAGREYGDTTGIARKPGRAGV